MHLKSRHICFSNHCILHHLTRSLKSMLLQPVITSPVITSNNKDGVSLVVDIESVTQLTSTMNQYSTLMSPKRAKQLSEALHLCLLDDWRGDH